MPVLFAPPVTRAALFERGFQDGVYVVHVFPDGYKFVKWCALSKGFKLGFGHGAKSPKPF